MKLTINELDMIYSITKKGHIRNNDGNEVIANTDQFQYAPKARCEINWRKYEIKRNCARHRVHHLASLKHLKNSRAPFPHTLRSPTMVTIYLKFVIKLIAIIF